MVPACLCSAHLFLPGPWEDAAVTHDTLMDKYLLRERQVPLCSLWWPLTEDHLDSVSSILESQTPAISGTAYWYPQTKRWRNKRRVIEPKDLLSDLYKYVLACSPTHADITEYLMKKGNIHAASSVPFLSHSDWLLAIQLFNHRLQGRFLRWLL